MSDKPKKELDELLDSNYDGIQEYDNDLPGWWVYLFYLTIIISAIYVVWVHYGPGLLPREKLSKDMAVLEEVRAAAQARMEASRPAKVDLVALSSDTAALASGKTIFIEKCAACHTETGGGLVGPNLTDAYWIHGGTVTDIKRIVENGVLEKGMLAWKGILKPEEIDDVTAFVWSIRNTNVEGGKAPEGELLEDESVQDDSVVEDQVVEDEASIG